MPGAIASANEARGTRLNYVGPCSKSTIQRERYLQHAPAVLHGPAAWMITVVHGGGIGESELSVDDGQGRLHVHVTGFVAREEQHTYAASVIRREHWAPQNRGWGKSRGGSVH
jgi:hypothetical protein